MFDPKSDPLGVGVQNRAKDARWNDMLHGRGQMGGPLVDPQWDGWFQALKEASGGNVNMAAGPSPAGSNQLTGFNTNGQVGGESYSSTPRSVMHGLRPAGEAPRTQELDHRTTDATPYGGSSLEKDLHEQLANRIVQPTPANPSARQRSLKVSNSLSALQNAKGAPRG